MYGLCSDYLLAYCVIANYFFLLCNGAVSYPFVALIAPQVLNYIC